MNWKLILQPAVFGIAMGVGSVFSLPSTGELILWPIVFLFSAYAIANTAGDCDFSTGCLSGCSTVC